jgi:hypothetical protein
MSAEKALFNAYRKWRRLAKAEGEAIRRRDWIFLSDCQQALKSLQPIITDLTNQARDEWKQCGLDCTQKENVLRSVVLELMEIGRRNRALLQLLLESAQNKIHQLGQAGRNLKRLRSSYAPMFSTV